MTRDRQDGAIILAIIAAFGFTLFCFFVGDKTAKRDPVVQTRIVRVDRPRVNNKASFAQAVANLDVKNPAGVGEYITGFKCAAWSNGNRATQHGWIVYYCVK